MPTFMIGDRDVLFVRGGRRVVPAARRPLSRPIPRRDRPQRHRRLRRQQRPSAAAHDGELRQPGAAPRDGQSAAPGRIPRQHPPDCGRPLTCAVPRFPLRAALALAGRCSWRRPSSAFVNNNRSWQTRHDRDAPAARLERGASSRRAHQRLSDWGCAAERAMGEWNLYLNRSQFVAGARLDGADRGRQPGQQRLLQQHGLRRPVRLDHAGDHAADVHRDADDRDRHGLQQRVQLERV